ncbi:MAG: uracil-DNA glycosylase, partial [Mycobacteriaceae bacterium]|nr:uracil-DNA glycosylase [Mycobacteriaceae bacterium]
VNSPISVDAADGLRTTTIRIVAPVRCAPPANKPTPAERATCSPWLDAEWRLVSEHVRVIVALGGFAWRIVGQLAGAAGTGKPPFGHGAVGKLASGVPVLGCYHPSQQNMFTGRLTPAMLDDIFRTAKKMADLG